MTLPHNHPAQITLRRLQQLIGKAAFGSSSDQHAALTCAEQLLQYVPAGIKPSMASDAVGPSGSACRSENVPALQEALREAKYAISSMKTEAETAAQGDEQMMLEACEQISNEGLEASLAIDAVLGTWDIHQIQEPALVHAAPTAVAVPDGWKLVPCEPQDMQQAAGAQAIRFDTTLINKMWTANKVYREMVASAPECAALATTPAAAPTYIEVRECSACGHIGINDADGTKAACNTCEWQGESPVEDKCPGCNTEGTMTTACPKCGARTSLIAETTLQTEAATPPAAPDMVSVKQVDANNYCQILAALGMEEEGDPVAEVQNLRALSVTNILMAVVPGLDGMGHEIYATSVAEVVEKLSDLGCRLEDYQLGIAVAPQALTAHRDAAFEAVRQKFCKLQRYSFFLDEKGNVRRTPDYCGNWVEFEAVHTLFEPAAVEAALAAQATQGGD